MDSERLLAISQLLCPLEGMVDELDRMGIVVGFVRVMPEMMMEKIAFFVYKGLRGRFLSCCHRALGNMICWARVLLLICAYGYKDVKSGSDLHWFPLPWRPLSYSSTKEGGQEVGGFEKRLQIYLYCWMSRRKTLPSFWVKNYTPWDNYEHFSKFLSSPTWLGRPWTPEVSLMSC